MPGVPGKEFEIQKRLNRLKDKREPTARNNNSNNYGDNNNNLFLPPAGPYILLPPPPRPPDPFGLPPPPNTFRPPLFLPKMLEIFIFLISLEALID